MVSFSVDLDDFSLRLRVAPTPSVPRARKPRMDEGSGTGCSTAGESPLTFPTKSNSWLLFTKAENSELSLSTVHVLLIESYVNALITRFTMVALSVSKENETLELSIP